MDRALSSLNTFKTGRQLGVGMIKSCKKGKIEIYT